LMTTIFSLRVFAYHLVAIAGVKLYSSCFSDKTITIASSGTE